MVTMIGLAVGIDYSLFIVSRYREERKKGYPKLEAIARTGGTANRAVFFSGLTVVLALLRDVHPADDDLPEPGDGRDPGDHRCAGGVDDAAAGDPRPARRQDQLAAAVEAGADGHLVTTRAAASGTGSRDGVMARPVVFLIGGVLLLGALGSYYFQLHRGTSQNVSQLSDDFPSKQAFLTLEREFSGRRDRPGADHRHRGRRVGAAAQAAIANLRSAIAARARSPSRHR